MLVGRILQFLDDIKPLLKADSDDSRLYSTIYNYFKEKNHQDILSEPDIQFILSCYENRWGNGIEDDNDCTLDSSGMNQFWIQLAEDLTSVTNKKVFQILFPTVKNTVDFNDLSPLHETKRPENFFWGRGGQVLYRKRSLCERLLANNFALTSIRSINQNTIGTLTVGELSRLKRCRREEGVFFISNEKFNCFWDFITKKVYPHLQDNGEMPLSILPLLVKLIESYYSLQASEADFTLFQEQVKLVLRSLYHIEFNKINFLYGVKIPNGMSESYLLDILISIKEAKSYTLHNELQTLALWLFRYNSILKCTCSETAHLYEKPQSSSHAITIKTVSSNPHVSLDSAFCFVTSLMTTQFKFLPLCGSTIHFWDRSNSVFSDAVEWYDALALDNAHIDEEQLLLAYKTIITQMSTDSSFSLSRYPETEQWLRLVTAGDFASLNIHWFDPKLLFHALWDFKSGDEALNLLINQFLDNIINTYAQTHNKVHKKIRVNLLFSDLLAKLNPENKSYLLMLFTLQDMDVARAAFLNNCQSYLVSRLRSFEPIKSGGSISFFSSTCKINEAPFKLINGELDCVSKILDAYKTLFCLPELALDTSSLKRCSTYIDTLSEPILSVAINNAVRSYALPSDYLNSPT